MELDRRSMLKILGGCTVTGFLQTWTKQNRSYADVATQQSFPGSAPPRIPLASSAQLDERSQRSHLVEGKIPSLLPAESPRRSLGRHALGPRGKPRHDSLASRIHRARSHARRSRQRRMLQWVSGGVQRRSYIYLHRRAECAAGQGHDSRRQRQAARDADARDCGRRWFAALEEAASL